MELYINKTYRLTDMNILVIMHTCKLINKVDFLQKTDSKKR